MWLTDGRWKMGSVSQVMYDAFDRIEPEYGDLTVTVVQVRTTNER